MVKTLRLKRDNKPLCLLLTQHRSQSFQWKAAIKFNWFIPFLHFSLWCAFPFLCSPFTPDTSPLGRCTAYGSNKELPSLKRLAGGIMTLLSSKHADMHILTLISWVTPVKPHECLWREYEHLQIHWSSGNKESISSLTTWETILGTHSKMFGKFWEFLHS